MEFDQLEYIKEYNKQNYKMYQFRIKKSDKKIISFLDRIKNRNNYINSLIEKDLYNDVLSIAQIKNAIMPIMRSRGIENVCLFGDYARGEANKNSNVNIYCDRGSVQGIYKVNVFTNELRKSLGKDVEIIFTNSQINPFYKEELRRDLIKLYY